MLITIESKLQAVPYIHELDKGWYNGCMQTVHLIGTIFKTIPAQTMSCTCTEFDDCWIKLSNFIKICIAYNKDTVDPIWFIFELTRPWTGIQTYTNFGNY